MISTCKVEKIKLNRRDIEIAVYFYLGFNYFSSKENEYFQKEMQIYKVEMDSYFEL